jgi:hypothetical protein
VPDLERIVAIGLLTQRDLDVLGTGFERAFPLQSNADFEDLLAKLDEVTASTTGTEDSSD